MTFNMEQPRVFDKKLKATYPVAWINFDRKELAIDVRSTTKLGLGMEITRGWGDVELEGKE